MTRKAMLTYLTGWIILMALGGPFYCLNDGKRHKCVFFFFLMIRPPPKFTLFPYPTLFRSSPEKASRVLGHRLGDGLFNDRIGNAVTAKTLRHNCNRTAFLPSEIFPERLADVETDEGLITAEPESRRNLLEIVKNVFWHPNAYRSHRTVL